MRIKELINNNVKELNRKNIHDANFKVRYILVHILNVSKEYLIIHDDDVFPEEKITIFEEAIKRLENNEPIQYIVNHQEFYGLDFYVDENVLIPQPDTEILVEECIKIFQDVEKNPQHKFYNKKECKILDLCTGSGAIGISLAKNIKKSKVSLSDISLEALKIAEKNAMQNQIEVTSIQSDLFKNINNKFDLIVSNPPYIETETIQKLSEEVRKEPIIALDGGIDGLKFYREIAEQAKSYLEQDGYLALEIGYNQKESVKKILKECSFRNIYSKKDFGGNDRIVVAQK